MLEGLAQAKWLREVVAEGLEPPNCLFGVHNPNKCPEPTPGLGGRSPMTIRTTNVASGQFLDNEIRATPARDVPANILDSARA
jgi:hypothetical protein